MFMLAGLLLGAVSAPRHVPTAAWSYSITLQRESAPGLPPTTVPPATIHMSFAPINEQVGNERIVNVSLSGANVPQNAIVTLDDLDDGAYEAGWCVGCASDSARQIIKCTPLVPVLSQALMSQRIRLNNATLALQVVGSNRQQPASRGETVVSGILSRIDNPREVYFTAYLRGQRIVSLSLFKVVAPQGYFEGNLSIVPDTGSEGAPLPLVFMSCYLSALLGYNGLCS